jgi:hypothetical protein
MARRSILTGVREEQHESAEAEAALTEAAPVPATIKPSRKGKLHLGGYYDPNNPTVIAFQKLGIDLRKTQQEMILDAIHDFVARQQASRAFNES